MEDPREYKKISSEKSDSILSQLKYLKGKTILDITSSLSGDLKIVFTNGSILQIDSSPTHNDLECKITLLKDIEGRL